MIQGPPRTLYYYRRWRELSTDDKAVRRVNDAQAAVGHVGVVALLIWIGQPRAKITAAGARRETGEWEWTAQVELDRATAPG